MKLPEYSLIKEVTIISPGKSDPITFKLGTLVQPMWNESFLSSQRRKELLEAKNNFFTKWNKTKDEENDYIIMCVISVYWVPVRRSFIKEK